MECEWAVTCEHALVTQDGKLSTIGISDELGANAFPATHRIPSDQTLPLSAAPVRKNLGVAGLNLM